MSFPRKRESRGTRRALAPWVPAFALSDAHILKPTEFQSLRTKRDGLPSPSPRLRGEGRGEGWFREDDAWRPCARTSLAIAINIRAVRSVILKIFNSSQGPIYFLRATAKRKLPSPQPSPRLRGEGVLTPRARPVTVYSPSFAEMCESDSREREDDTEGPAIPFDWKPL